jgi:LacI family transcriptional regulator
MNGDTPGNKGPTSEGYRIPLHDIAGRLFTRALHEISGGPDQPGQLVTAPLVVRSSA